jgi:RNA polymerase sigma factor (sigma-70 family)
MATDRVPDVNNLIPSSDVIADFEVRDIVEHTLDADNRAILKLYLYGYTQKEIGEYLHINQSNVSRRITKCCKFIKIYL